MNDKMTINYRNVKDVVIDICEIHTDGCPKNFKNMLFDDKE